MTNEKNDKQVTVAHASACGTSIVCMAQMGTASAAAGTMAGMSAVSTSTAVSAPFITVAFQAIGLGFLFAVPQIFYQVLLILILAVTAVSSYFSYRLHRRVGPFVLAVASSLVIYSSIYLLASEPLYWTGFALMTTSAIWSYLVTKPLARKRAPRTKKLIGAHSPNSLVQWIDITHRCIFQEEEFD